MNEPHVVLVGGGHAHLRVVRSIRQNPWPARCTLVSPARTQFYSGMVPGYLQGRYGAQEIQIDLAGLCDRAGIDFIEATALALDASRRIVRTDVGDVAFDHASIDVGSVPSGLGLPGVGEHALALRPRRRAVELRQRIDRLVDRVSGERPVRVAVVGAGAAGFEVALALHERIALRGGLPGVMLVEAEPRILAAYSDRVRRKAERVLERRRLRVVAESAVAAVDEAGVTLASGGRLEADAVVWTTGPAPPPLLGRTHLPLSEDGYLAVDESLRSSDGAPVWGAGDCASVADWDLPKAGVYAVRQGPVLARNLRAALAGEEPVRYRPQKSFLSLLNTADGKALLRWKGLVAHSALAWSLKDRIDRSFVDEHGGSSTTGRARGRPARRR